MTFKLEVRIAKIRIAGSHIINFEFIKDLVYVDQLITTYVSGNQYEIILNKMNR
jgi:hypothetical protein